MKSKSIWTIILFFLCLHQKNKKVKFSSAFIVGIALSSGLDGDYKIPVTKNTLCKNYFCTKYFRWGHRAAFMGVRFPGFTKACFSISPPAFSA